MPDHHPIQCRCGQVRGSVQPTRPSNHCVCHCADCQAFARHLGSPQTLDGQGGTDIVQLPASRVRFSQGHEQLACIRLTDKGLVRWYASCCRTPLGNTLADAKADFVGLIGVACAAASFGPVTMRVGVDSALGADKPKASGVLRGVAKVLGFIVAGRLRGSWRAGPFFDPRTGLPVAPPRVLSAAELAAARHAG